VKMVASIITAVSIAFLLDCVSFAETVKDNAACAKSSAVQEAPKKAKGLEVVTEAATSVIDKADALLTGDLKITMSTEKEKAKKKKDYTLDALGVMVPKETM
jgi:hypothetical protein